jgi:hypothetical protein
MTADLEAGLLVVLSLVARPLAAYLWPRLQDKTGEWSEALEASAPWLHAVGPFYISLLTGAVLGSRLGIYGFGLEGSLLGALFGMVILAGLYAVRRFRPGGIELPGPPVIDKALQDEMRWGFYRGAAAGWLGHLWLGGLAGFGLALVEWAATLRPWNSSVWKEPAQWSTLVRAGISAVLYGLSGNLWLILVVQTLVVVIWGLELAQNKPEAGNQE